MQGPAVKKMKKSVISEGTMESQIRPQSPLVPRKESSQLECSPAFKDLKQIFDLFLSKGLDRTALSIDNNYRVHPYVCVCQEPCCNCINHSQHIHKLGLHHQNEALNEVRKNIAPESLVLQFNEGGTSLKSLVREQSQVSGQVPLSQPMIPLVDEGIKKMSVKTLKSVLGNTNTDTDAEVEEEKGTTGKKSPLDISPQTQSNRQSFQSDFTNITSRGSMLAPVIQELTNINIQDSVKPLKCKPSIRSIRRNFKEIEPAKYQNLLLEMINNPENCLLSHQSKKERVLRPKLVPNDCHAKRPKWRI
ncbi:uncharacterized protein LOC106672024 isoform X2 [Cimex lectularius]|nr:uncharacterized protein LOC106672024 isoform X2 [Cimex lectularius]